MLYKEPYAAFGVMDHEGRGYLVLDDFRHGYVASRSGLSPEEITAFFTLQNSFPKERDTGLIFSKFRELFFPHMTLAGEDPPNLQQPVKETEYNNQARTLDL